MERRNFLGLIGIGVVVVSMGWPYRVYSFPSDCILLGSILLESPYPEGTGWLHSVPAALKYQQGLVPVVGDGVTKVYRIWKQGLGLYVTGPHGNTLYKPIKFPTKPLYNWTAE